MFSPDPFPQFARGRDRKSNRPWPFQVLLCSCNIITFLEAFEILCRCAEGTFFSVRLSLNVDRQTIVCITISLFCEWVLVRVIAARGANDHPSRTGRRERGVVAVIANNHLN